MLHIIVCDILVRSDTEIRDSKLFFPLVPTVSHIFIVEMFISDTKQKFMFFRIAEMPDKIKKYVGELCLYRTDILMYGTYEKC